MEKGVRKSLRTLEITIAIKVDKDFVHGLKSVLRAVVLLTRSPLRV